MPDAESRFRVRNVLAAEFAESFRNEHRRIRDILLALMDVFRNCDLDAARAKVDEMAAEAVPHLEYEGEALYPALAECFGDGYVNQLRAEQALAFAAARELVVLTDREQLTPETAQHGVELIRVLFAHVSDRDGLALIVEVLAPEQIAEIVAARQHAKDGKVVPRKAQKCERKGADKTGKSGRPSGSDKVRLRARMRSRNLAAGNARAE
jgi:hypothetical protein